RRHPPYDTAFWATPREVPLAHLHAQNWAASAIRFTLLRGSGMPSSDDSSQSASFGPYLLVRAAGALGRLEMAVRTDVRDPEVCILKRLPIRALAADAAARFRRHAQLAARLEHENVARTLRVETI